MESRWNKEDCFIKLLSSSDGKVNRPDWGVETGEKGAVPRMTGKRMLQYSGLPRKKQVHSRAGMKVSSTKDGGG